MYIKYMYRVDNFWVYCRFPNAGIVAICFIMISNAKFPRCNRNKEYAAQNIYPIHSNE